MNLLFTLPSRSAEALKTLDDSELCYCVPCDIISGQLAKAYLAVTAKSVVLLLDDKAIKSIKISQITDATTLVSSDCAQLILTDTDSVEHLFCTVSMHHASRYAYVARGIRMLIKGDRRLIRSEETERICPKCGKALPGTAVCPKCGDKGRMLRRIIRLITPYRWQFIAAASLMLLASLLNVAMGFVNRELVDNVLRREGATVADALVIIAVLAVLIAMMILTYILRNRVSVKLGSSISLDLRERMYIKIQQLSISFLNRRTPGVLMNRMTHDTNQIRAFMQNTFANMFNQLLTMLFSLIAMLVMDWKLTLMSVCLVPFVFIISTISRKFFGRIFHKQWMKSDAVHGRLQDVLSGIRVVKSFGMEQRESELFEKGNEEIARLSERNEKAWSTITPLFSFFFSIGTLIITLYGGVGILEGTFTAGDMSMFTFFATALYSQLLWMGNLPRTVVQMLTSLERVFDILDEHEELPSADKPIEHAIEGNVSFKNVGFGYKSYEPVLENFSLDVKKGEMIGLVGASGAGKSTLINLVMRMYDVDEGSILVDGVDIRDIDKTSLHRQIGVVLQEPFLFSGSIVDNIRYSKPEATLEEVMLAAKLANAHDFIVRFPDGYNTRVGENGHNLSGGERQRVAIARAILNDPKILILDEATSALDTETEYQIQEALGRLIKGRTTFAIAHRLSTLRGADRLVVIDKHTCAEVGTHEELLRKKGIYYGLVMAQLNMNKVNPAQ
ncbi:MAG: ATP-binding cassette domain-containing protein [Clostridia bacterium]|nr:ATP-binding cassette domain-containing protein [Clostridia bacterium]